MIIYIAKDSLLAWSCRKFFPELDLRTHVAESAGFFRKLRQSACSLRSIAHTEIFGEINRQDNFRIGLVILARIYFPELVEQLVLVRAVFHLIDHFLGFVGCQLIIFRTLVQRPACHGEIHLCQCRLCSCPGSDGIHSVDVPRFGSIFRRQIRFRKFQILH